MNRREEPQIAQSLLQPLLELDSIDTGRKIFKVFDQKDFHWQLIGYRVMGIDNKKECLLVKDSLNTPQAIPFNQLHQYVVMRFGFDENQLIPIDFRTYEGEINRSDKYFLHTHASKIKGRVLEYAGGISIAAPKEFFDWVANKPFYMKPRPWLESLSPYSVQTILWDSVEKSVKIEFKKKLYTEELWLSKTKN